ncbi:ALDH-like protein [Sarocladium strictum]
MAINNDGPESQDSKVVLILATSDIDQAVTYTHQVLLPNTSTTRILVHTSIHDLFLQSLLDAIEASQTHIPDIDTIPEITEENLQRIHDLATSAREQGAKVVTGGIPPVRGNLGGFFERPMVVDGVRPEMGLFREGVTGPLATVTTFDEEDELIPWVNEILTGAEVVVFADDGDEARKLAAEIQSVPVHVNAEATKT